MNTDPTPYGGHVIHVPTSEALPLHALSVGPDCVIQFADAASLVAFARANYNATKGTDRR